MTLSENSKEDSGGAQKSVREPKECGVEAVGKCSLQLENRGNNIELYLRDSYLSLAGYHSYERSSVRKANQRDGTLQRASQINIGNGSPNRGILL